MKFLKINIVIFLAFFSTCKLIAQNKDTIQIEIKETEKFNRLNNLHEESKELSVKKLFEGEEGITRSLQLNKNGILEEHIAKTKAILICVSGEVVYEDENKTKNILKAGDFQRIEPYVKHWVVGIDDSQLLLIK
nr:cupin domain-containing protein [uncultured Flavobacterium sp.]